MPPTLQTPSLPIAAVWDYIYDPSGQPVVGHEVTAYPNYELFTDPTINVPIRLKAQRGITDQNGMWVLWLVPNDVLSPTNGCYVIKNARVRSYRVRPVTPTAALSTDADAFLVPTGPAAGTWVHGQRSDAINISYRPPSL